MLAIISRSLRSQIVRRLIPTPIKLFSQENKPKQNSKQPSSDPLTGDPKMKSIDEEEGKEKDDAYQTTSFGNYMIGISAVSLLLAYGVMQVQSMRAQKTKPQLGGSTQKVVATGKAQIGGQWSLLDTKGNPISSKDFQGSYYLIYFGFTNCPDICPNSLSKLSRAVQKVKKHNSLLKLKSIFVSVDPDRDSPQKIDKFVHLFDPEMIGVTAKSNNDPALKECMRKFKIYATKIQFQDEDVTMKGRKSYTIDHTILTYLMNQNNQYIAHLGANLGEQDLMNAILTKIEEDTRKRLQKLRN